MSSIEELKAIRCYRAFSTILQLCQDRGYVVRHPSLVAAAMQDPQLYDRDGDGIEYDWFLRHFVLTPDTAAEQLAMLSSSSQRPSSSGGGRLSQGSPSNNNNDTTTGGGESEEEAQARRAALMRRVAAGEWVVMRNAMRLTCVEASQTERRAGLMVFFSESPALTVKEVQEFREKALRKQMQNMIVVTAGRVAPGVRRDVQELSGRLEVHTGKELLRIQIFEEEALACNVAQHETVPKHVALTEKEAQELLRSHQLTLSQLPRMLESDPMVQYLGLTRGDVVHITRESKESGPYDMYRQVI